MFYQIIIFTIGFILLYNGAEFLVNGSEKLAKKLGLSQLVIGLTVVAFGTSAPELIVSIISLYREKNMIAIGNVIGSNICNFSMVLGIVCIIQPVITEKKIFQYDIPILIFSSIFLLFISLDSKISHLNGITLFMGNISYIFFSYFDKKKEKKIYIANLDNKINKKQKNKKKLKFNITQIILGIFYLIIGAELLVGASIKIMFTLGLSERFIGLTVVAIGTSLPELAASIFAISKKQINISIGNLIGSNIFNLLSVIGISSIIQPIFLTPNFIKSNSIFDYSVMILTSCFPLLLIKNNKQISKIKGVFFILTYLIYITILFYRL